MAILALIVEGMAVWLWITGLIISISELTWQFLSLKFLCLILLMNGDYFFKLLLNLGVMFNFQWLLHIDNWKHQLLLIYVLLAKPGLCSAIVGFITIGLELQSFRTALNCVPKLLIFNISNSQIEEHFADEIVNFGWFLAVFAFKLVVNQIRLSLGLVPFALNKLEKRNCLFVPHYRFLKWAIQVHEIGLGL